MYIYIYVCIYMYICIFICIYISISIYRANTPCLTTGPRRMHMHRYIDTTHLFNHICVNIYVNSISTGLYEQALAGPSFTVK